MDAQKKIWNNKPIQQIEQKQVGPTRIIQTIQGDWRWTKNAEKFIAEQKQIEI